MVVQLKNRILPAERYHNNKRMLSIRSVCFGMIFGIAIMHLLSNTSSNTTNSMKMKKGGEENDKTTTTTPSTTNITTAGESTTTSVLASSNTCPPLSHSDKDLLGKEIADYEKSKRFKDKIEEVKGTVPLAAHHQSIIKYLREKVLQPEMVVVRSSTTTTTKTATTNWSVLELGCAAGKMLSLVEEWYYEQQQQNNNSNNNAVFVGVELVTGWVNFAQSYFSSVDDKVAQARGAGLGGPAGKNDPKKRNMYFLEGDITAFTPHLPPSFLPLTSDTAMDTTTTTTTTSTTTSSSTNIPTFDFVMLNDVAEHIQKDRYVCFFQELKKVTHDDSLVYFHTPNPQTQLVDSEQYFENVLPHHMFIEGMAKYGGFELITLEQDVDTNCRSGMSKNYKTMKHLRDNIHCATNNYPKYYHAVFRRVPQDKLDVFELK